MMKNNRSLAVLVIICLFTTAFVVMGDKNIVPAFSTDLELSGVSEAVECEPDEYFTIYDKEGNVVDKTGRFVRVGDEFITEDNSHYKVDKVDEDKYSAEAEYLGKETVTLKVEGGAVPISSMISEAVPVQEDSKKNLIAAYHTHSDESYVPTDGEHSIPGDGGIFEVGNTFSEKLRSMGIEVVHEKTSHEPHDADAYKRSRRTAAKLISKNPAAVIDIHRDGIPDPEFYKEEIDGETVSQIRLVVGRQNQNKQANYDFAKRLKGYADEKYPGLIKGIYLADGNYNQDLSPRSVIIEAGTYTMPQEQAEKGTELFAEVLPGVLGITSSPIPGVTQEETGIGGDFASVIFVIAAVIVGTAAYLVISTGSVEGAVKKAKEFITIEWTNFFGRLKKQKNDENGEDDERHK